MNSKAQEMILHLIHSCIHSEISLSAFCEEFSFHYLHLDEGIFKKTCQSLFHLSSQWIMRESDATITPDEIQFASDLLSNLEETYTLLYKQLLRS